ncbi:MAG: sugar phosphate isomerase/epimerase [Deltaproteobacteria bacterium]|nr:MAG: sugar phosphate isomerase/epimerase [Deltaproteobacteria bacterium]
MKIGCCSVNFRQYSLDEAMGWISEGGFEYIELEANLHWCNHADPRRDDPVKMREKAARFGLKISSVGSHRELITDEEVNYDAVADIQNAIRWAREAGIPIVVTGEGRKPGEMSEEAALANIRKRLEKILPVAEECEVSLCFEPHGSISLSPGGLGKILSLVPSRWVGVNFDTANPRRGNFMHPTSKGLEWMLGDALPQSDEITILTPIARSVRNVHFKDVVGKDAVCLGHGQVDLKGCVRILHESGFEGVLSWQTEGFQTAEETRAWMKESRQFMVQALQALKG